jgi:hypothetical protein
MADATFLLDCTPMQTYYAGLQRLNGLSPNDLHQQ